MHGLMPEEAPGRGGSRGRHEGTVKAVHIKGDVDILWEVCRQGMLRQARGRQLRAVVGSDACLCPEGCLFPAVVSGAELHQGKPCVLYHAPQHTGMAEAIVLIDGAQVRVGIKVQDAEVSAGISQGFDGCVAHGVLTAQSHGNGTTGEGSAHCLHGVSKDLLQGLVAVDGLMGIEAELAW